MASETVAKLIAAKKGTLDLNWSNWQKHLGEGGWSISCEPSDVAIYEATVALDDSMKRYFAESLYAKCSGSMASNLRSLSDDLKAAFLKAVSTRKIVHVLDESSTATQLKATFEGGRMVFRAPAKTFCGYSTGEQCGRFLKESLTAWVESGGSGGAAAKPAAQSAAKPAAQSAAKPAGGAAAPSGRDPALAAALTKVESGSANELKKMDAHTKLSGWSIKLEPSVDALYAAAVAADANNAKRYFAQGVMQKLPTVVGSRMRTLKDRKDAFEEAVTVPEIVVKLSGGTSGAWSCELSGKSLVFTVDGGKGLAGYSSTDGAGSSLIRALDAWKESKGPKAGGAPVTSGAAGGGGAGSSASRAAMATDQRKAVKLLDNEVLGLADNGKEYLIQNGVPYEVSRSFTGFNPKVKFITATIKQWFNPNDYDEHSMPDELKEIAKQVYKSTGTSAADTDVGQGENLFAKRELKTCSMCKGTGKFGRNMCKTCKGKGKR